MNNRLTVSLSQFFIKLRQTVLNNWHYILVFVFGMVVTVGLWSNIDSMIVRSDGYFHGLRLQSVTAAIKNGQLVPQVFPDGADGFGYAYNIFYGPLTTYIAAVFRILRFSWPVAVNLTYIFLLIASGLMMCYAVLQISRNKAMSSLAGILYLFAPYHLVDLFQRVAIGEFAALAFTPLLFLGLYQLMNKQRHAIRHLVISVTAILLSHNLSLVIFAVAAIIFIVFYLKILSDKSIWRSSIVAVMAILGLSAFYLVPLAEAKIISNYGIFDQEYASVYFEANAKSLNTKRLSATNLIWGDYDINNSVALNASIGWLALLAIIVFPLMRNKIVAESERKFVTVLYIISLVALLLTTKLINWSFAPGFLLNMQFPWRFLSIFCVTICFVEGYVLYSLFSNVDLRKQCTIVAIVGLIAASSVSQLLITSLSGGRLSPRSMPANDIANGSAGWQAEYLPTQLLCDGQKCGRKIADQVLSERGDGVVVLDGAASIENIERDGLRVSFLVDAHDETSIEVPLVFYPGYKAVMNGARIEVKPSERMGLVEIKVPAGASGVVSVYYGLSAGTIIGVAISALSVSLIGVVLLAKSKRNRG